MKYYIEPRAPYVAGWNCISGTDWNGNIWKNTEYCGSGFVCSCWCL